MSDLQNLTSHVSAPVATGPDQSRQAATDDEYISIKEALDIFIANSRPVTERTLQRYCEKQQLSGQKMVTAEGEKWFVTRSSVLHRIEELKKFDELRASRLVATSTDMSAPVAQVNQNAFAHDTALQGSTENVSAPVVSPEVSHSTSHDMSRQDATGRGVSDAGETSQPQNATVLSSAERDLYERLLNHLEEQRVDLIKDKELLIKQLDAKDKQIDRFFQSERDTKSITARLQNMVASIWPQLGSGKGESDRYVPVQEALDSTLPSEKEEKEPS